MLWPKRTHFHPFCSKLNFFGMGREGLLVLLISVERCQHFGPPLYSVTVTSILRSMAFAFFKNFAWELHCLFRFLNPLGAKTLLIHYSLTSPSNNFKTGTTIHFTTALTTVYQHIKLIAPYCHSS